MIALLTYAWCAFGAERGIHRTSPPEGNGVWKSRSSPSISASTAASFPLVPRTIFHKFCGVAPSKKSKLLPSQVIWIMEISSFTGLLQENTDTI